MKVKKSQLQKAIREAIKLYIVKCSQDTDQEREHEDENGEEQKKDPRIDWSQTGKHLYDEAEDPSTGIDDEELTTDPERSRDVGDNIFGDEDQETFTKIQKKKIDIKQEAEEIEGDEEIEEAENEEGEEELDEKAPKGAGWEKVVKGLKKSDVDNPWAVAHWMKSQGIKPKNESIQEGRKAKKDKKTQKEDMYQWSLGYVLKQRDAKKKAKKD